MMNPLYRKMFRDPMAGRKPQGILASSVPMMTAAQKAMAQNQPIKAQTGMSVDLTQNPALNLIAQDVEMVNAPIDMPFGSVQPTQGERLLKNSMAGQIDITSPFKNAAQEQEAMISGYESAVAKSDKDLVEKSFQQVYGDQKPLKTEEENVQEGIDLMQKYLGNIDPRAKEKNLYMAVMRAGLEYASGKELGEAGLAALDQFSVGAKEIADEEKGLIKAGVQLGLDRTETEKTRDQALKDAKFNAEFNYLLEQDRADRDAKKTAFNARYGFLTQRIENEAEQIKLARTIASQETQLAAQLNQQLEIANDDRRSQEERTEAQIAAARTNAIIGNLNTGATIAFEGGWQKGLRGDELVAHMQENAPILSKLLDDPYLKDYSPSRLRTMAIQAVVDLDTADTGKYIDSETGQLTAAGQAIVAQYTGPLDEEESSVLQGIEITSAIQSQLDDAGLTEGDQVKVGGATYIIKQNTLVPVGDSPEE